MAYVFCRYSSACMGHSVNHPDQACCHLDKATGRGLSDRFCREQGHSGERGGGLARWQFISEGRRDLRVSS